MTFRLMLALMQAEARDSKSYHHNKGEPMGKNTQIGRAEIEQDNQDSGKMTPVESKKIPMKAMVEVAVVG